MTVWSADSADVALASLEKHLPELVVLQATASENWTLCKSIRQQWHPLWVYCIWLDHGSDTADLTPHQVLQRQAQRTSKAMEVGGDTYLWWPVQQASPRASPQLQEDPGLGRIMQAHIRAGLQRVQAYRDLSQTNDLLSAIALSDALTELGNRRALDWELPREIQSTRKLEQPLSLLILDIDFFKSVNDRHGHLVGDQVLQMVAERLRHNMRFYETPFRYGGEEFVILLKNTSLEEGERVGERLRQLMDNNPFVIDAELDLSLTVSIGVATLQPNDDEAGMTLLGRADRNLLKAKATGRNRVVVSSVDPSV
ncbi:MAG: GGDEF domain-containing protein [Cyanobacteria bacterium]|nr:GGDEF domain-containing protein [Cyanobacteriota bacterium]MDA0865793.1 GGDEF domain-containing protein [Cyanobacteriota bacterium]